MRRVEIGKIGSYYDVLSENRHAQDALKSAQPYKNALHYAQSWDMYVVIFDLWAWSRCPVLCTYHKTFGEAFGENNLKIG